MPLQVAITLAALFAEDAAARHRAVLPAGRIVASVPNCHSWAPVLLHV